MEKAFGLTSGMIGLIKNVDNIGYVIAVIIIAQLCRYANKPRIFAIAALCNAVSVAMFALPYFLYDNRLSLSADHHDQHLGSNVSYPIGSDTPDNTQLCVPYIEGEADRDKIRQEKCETSGDVGELYNSGAAAIFIISCMAQGAAGSPKFSMTLTYLDDNDSMKSTLYFGE